MKGYFMKILTVLMLIVMLLAVGCGVNKDYVAQQIEASEARTATQLDALTDKTDGNASEIAKLQSLSAQLSEKTDLAINKAKGFENYQILWQGEINFDFDSYDVNAAAEAILNEAGQKLEQNPGSLIEIVGHTDKTGNAKYNLMLGEQRAASAKRFLSERFGISLYRLFIVSYGEDKPIAMADESNANSKNRRVNLTVWGELK